MATNSFGSTSSAYSPQFNPYGDSRSPSSSSMYPMSSSTPIAPLPSSSSSLTAAYNTTPRAFVPHSAINLSVKTSSAATTAQQGSKMGLYLNAVVCSVQRLRKLRCIRCHGVVMISGCFVDLQITPKEAVKNTACSQNIALNEPRSFSPPPSTCPSPGRAAVSWPVPRGPRSSTSPGPTAATAAARQERRRRRPLQLRVRRRKSRRWSRRSRSTSQAVSLSSSRSRLGRVGTLMIFLDTGVQGGNSIV